MNIAKIKIKISLPSQYSVYFSYSDDEGVYIMVSIKIHVGKDMDSVHYYWDALYSNTETCWRCDDAKIMYFRGYSGNVYNELLHGNEQKTGGYKYYERIR